MARYLQSSDAEALMAHSFVTRRGWLLGVLIATAQCAPEGPEGPANTGGSGAGGAATGGSINLVVS